MIHRCLAIVTNAIKLVSAASQHGVKIASHLGFAHVDGFHCSHLDSRFPVPSCFTIGPTFVRSEWENCGLSWRSARRPFSGVAWVFMGRLM
jgi:hypothetical protein